MDRQKAQEIVDAAIRLPLSELLYTAEEIEEAVRANTTEVFNRIPEIENAQKEYRESLLREATIQHKIKRLLLRAGFRPYNGWTLNGLEVMCTKTASVGEDPRYDKPKHIAIVRPRRFVTRPRDKWIGLIHLSEKSNEILIEIFGSRNIAAIADISEKIRQQMNLSVRCDLVLRKEKELDGDWIDVCKTGP
ncbi:MAG: hypothetical protein HYT22_00645 [Candidatus Niyogibacteria bacterium]|nr:hypothetical protein [Candidatus Niyogibacteria bacterium]